MAWPFAIDHTRILEDSPKHAETWSNLWQQSKFFKIKIEWNCNYRRRCLVSQMLEFSSRIEEMRFYQNNKSTATTAKEAGSPSHYLPPGPHDAGRLEERICSHGSHSSPPWRFPLNISTSPPLHSRILGMIRKWKRHEVDMDEVSLGLSGTEKGLHKDNQRICPLKSRKQR